MTRFEDSRFFEPNETRNYELEQAEEDRTQREMREDGRPREYVEYAGYGDDGAYELEAEDRAQHREMIAASQAKAIRDAADAAKPPFNPRPTADKIAAYNAPALAWQAKQAAQRQASPLTLVEKSTATQPLETYSQQTAAPAIPAPPAAPAQSKMSTHQLRDRIAGMQATQTANGESNTGPWRNHAAEQRAEKIRRYTSELATRLEAEASQPPRPDPLLAPCPECGANAGDSCTNYKGQRAAPHSRRKQTPPAQAPPAETVQKQEAAEPATPAQRLTAAVAQLRAEWSAIEIIDECWASSRRDFKPLREARR
jgi:hypothetical protein